MLRVPVPRRNPETSSCDCASYLPVGCTPVLPPEGGGGGGGGGSRTLACARSATKLLIKCLEITGVAVGVSTAICVGACALTGPGWPACAADCLVAGGIAEEEAADTCLRLAIIDFIACEFGLIPAEAQPR